jgi:hypothetical protein
MHGQAGAPEGAGRVGGVVSETRAARLFHARRAHRLTGTATPWFMALVQGVSMARIHLVLRRPLRILLVALAALALHCEAFAAANPCNSAEYHQFDFWLGEWAVTEQGKPAGRNSIRSALGGCALLESWVAVDDMRGQSVNTYDRGRKLWHQTWVDDHGLLLVLDGGLSDGAMVLEGERWNPTAGAPSLERITWRALANGDVRQLWESSSDTGRTWKTVFDGLYRRSR